MTDLQRLADRALELEALREEVNSASWDARVRFEFELFKDIPDENAWCEKAMETSKGSVEPAFTREGFKVIDPDVFENWAASTGHAHLGWLVDCGVLDELDAANGKAYLDGSEVPGVVPLASVPNGVHLHPSKTTRESIKESIHEYLR